MTGHVWFAHCSLWSPCPCVSLHPHASMVGGRVGGVLDGGWQGRWRPGPWRHHLLVPSILSQRSCLLPPVALHSGFPCAYSSVAIFISEWCVEEAAPHSSLWGPRRDSGSWMQPCVLRTVSQGFLVFSRVYLSGCLCGISCFLTLLC